MHVIYRLRADELSEEFIQTLKNTYQDQEIIIISKENYEEELERIRSNAVSTEKTPQRAMTLDEGKGIVKTIAELQAIAEEWHDF